MLKSEKKISTIFVVALLFLTWWISDIPIGYYKFKKICESHGGLIVNEPLERNQGWLAEEESIAQIPFELGSASFVRVIKKNGATVDIHYRAGNPTTGVVFPEVPADIKESPTYVISEIKRQQLEGIRLFKSGYQVKDIHSGRTKLSFVIFSFKHTNPDRTLFGQTSTSICPANSIADLAKASAQLYGNKK